MSENGVMNMVVPCRDDVHIVSTKVIYHDTGVVSVVTEMETESGYLDYVFFERNVFFKKTD